MQHALIQASWAGPVILIGFGSVGRGTLPLILRHIACDRSKITVIDPSLANAPIVEELGIKFINQAITVKNYKKILTPLLTAESAPALIVNLSVDVGSMDLIKLARRVKALYIDTVIEPWPGFYDNSKLTNAERTNYKLRTDLMQLRDKLGTGPTAVSCCGANPGMVSWLLKQALLNIAQDQKLKCEAPQSREEWALFMKKLGVWGIHIAERDTQRAKKPKSTDQFLNTWSVDGFIAEGLQPAELGWGSFEKKLPPEGRRYKFGNKAAIYLERPGANTRVRSWVPSQGAHFGLLVTHNEAISISDYFTVRKGNKVLYRPTCHYAYHPCNDAILSLYEMFGSGKRQSVSHVLEADEIQDGGDELGVFIYGIKKNAYWYGSKIMIDEARALAPHQNATGMQITSAVLTGIIWAIENPQQGIVEAEDMDFKRCLEIQRPYLGTLSGTYTNWTPLSDRSPLFDEKLNKKKPWAFENFLVR